MNGGKFFNAAGLDQSGPEPQPNNYNNQGNFVGVDTMNGVSQQNSQMNQLMNGIGSSQMMGNPMSSGNQMSSENQMMQQPQMMSSQPMMSQQPQMMSPQPMVQQSAQQSMPQQSMMNSNPMSMGNPMMNNNPMAMGNPMNNASSMNAMPTQNVGINPEIAAQQSFSPMYQDPNPSIPPMNQGMMQPQQNPMASFPTGANQGPIGAQPNPMAMGNPMMNNNQAPQPQVIPNQMSMNNNMSDASSINQQTIMMSNDMPSFNNSLNGISPLEPMPTAVDTGKTIKMKSKLNLDFKKILIIGVVCLVAIMVVLSLLCYKTVTCTGKEEVSGAPVSVSVKAYFWFGKINKIVTTKDVDLSSLNESQKDYIKSLYEDKESVSNEKIDIKDNKIVITVTNAPNNDEEASITADDVIDSYEKYNFTCK